MKYLITSFFLLLGAMTRAQDFYDMNTIQTIEITFAQSNWDQLLDAAYAGSGDYIMAQSVTINGEVFDSVGVKYKGNSTYNANQVKNPWHIELDTYKEHDYEGYTDIKLANVAKDPSFLRDVLGYQILRQYMDAPLPNYANLYVNGTLIGLYSNTESISKKFVNNHFGSKGNAFFDCSPPEGAGPQGGDYPNLVYLGQDSTDYYEAYDIKSDAGWAELIDLCDTLANHTTAIEKILDVDKALWMLAFDNVIVNLDSYLGVFSQNYYLYRDDYGRFLPVVWDLNESFGVFSQTGTSNLNNITAKRQMSHLLHANDASWPLVQKLLSVPMYKRMYLAHFKTILQENFANGTYYDTGLALQNVIKAAVQADNNKFFTYNNFIANLTTDVTSGGGPMATSAPGITSLMNGRNTYLSALTDFTNTEPAISGIALSDPTPVISETITVTASVTNANSVYLGYRTEAGAPFERVQMFDDGAHGDGAANDGTYGVAMEIVNTFTQYYIYAENSNIGKFSPQRAEYEYHTITATISGTTTGDLVINEFMASNEATVADQDGEFDDWIELYNNTASPIDLGGYFLSDDAADLMKWQFPTGAFIDGNGYLIIWADDDEDQSGLHTSFKLSAAAESVFLVDASGTIIEEVSFVDQTTDISYGRYPNGTGNFQTMSPTFNAENMVTTGTSDAELEAVVLKVFPNPAQYEITVSASEELSSVLIFNLTGQVVSEHFPNSTEERIDIGHLAGGMYFIRAVTRDEKVLSQKIMVSK